MTDFTELEQKKPYGYIYRIDFPNDKVYIGLTTSLQKRKQGHKYKATSGNTRYLYNALRKYNMVDTFELIVIDTADTEEELCEKEIGYILMYNSFYKEYGYNMTYGGEGASGCIITEEQREKSSEAHKKYYENNPEAGKEHSEALKTYYRETPGAREKNSEALKKYYRETPGAIEKSSEAHKKYYREIPGAREKNSEALKKYFLETPGAREKNSEALKKYFLETPGAREKNSEALKKYYRETPEARKQISEAVKKCHEENPQLRKKMSQAKKNYFLETPGAIEKNREARIKYYKEHPNAGKEHGEKLIAYYKNNQEARERARERALKQFKNPNARQKILDGRGKNKKFDVLTKDGIFIKTFTYQMDAREYLKKEYNITSTIKISEVLNGNRNHSAGFVFKYKD